MSIKEAMQMEERMREPFHKILVENAKTLSDAERINLLHKLTESLVTEMFPEAAHTGKVMIDAYEIEGGVMTIPKGSPQSYIFIKVTTGEKYDADALFACRGVKVHGHPGLRCIIAEPKDEDTDYQLVRLSVPFSKRHLVKDIKLGTPDGKKVKLSGWLNIEVTIVENTDGNLASIPAAWDKHLSDMKKNK